jgi:hypothetical protein
MLKNLLLNRSSNMQQNSTMVWVKAGVKKTISSSRTALLIAVSLASSSSSAADWYVDLGYKFGELPILHTGTFGPGTPSSVSLSQGGLAATIVAGPSPSISISASNMNPAGYGDIRSQLKYSATVSGASANSVVPIKVSGLFKLEAASGLVDGSTKSQIILESTNSAGSFSSLILEGDLGARYVNGLGSLRIFEGVIGNVFWDTNQPGIGHSQTVQGEVSTNLGTVSLNHPGDYTFFERKSFGPISNRYSGITAPLTSLFGSMTGNFLAPTDASGNAIISISLNSQTSKHTLGSLTGFIDPFLEVDPMYLATHPTVTFAVEPGIGNAMPVPEPSTWALLFAGLLGLGYICQRLRAKSS